MLLFQIQMDNISAIRNKLEEILGTQAVRQIHNSEIEKLLDSFEGRPDIVECVIQSICEENFEDIEEELPQKEESAPGEKHWLEELITDGGFVFVPQQVSFYSTVQQNQN